MMKIFPCYRLRSGEKLQIEFVKETSHYKKARCYISMTVTKTKKLKKLDFLEAEVVFNV